GEVLREREREVGVVDAEVADALQLLGADGEHPQEPERDEQRLLARPHSQPLEKHRGSALSRKLRRPLAPDHHSQNILARLRFARRAGECITQQHRSRGAARPHTAPPAALRQAPTTRRTFWPTQSRRPPPSRWP